MKINKKHIIYAVLLVFVLFGLYLRVYHLNYPSIGYHNMKEHEYLDPAINYYNEGLFFENNFLHRKSFMFYGLDEGAGYHEEYNQVPMVSYTAFFLWKLTGDTQLWSVRLVMNLFMLGSVLLTYFIVKQLSKKEYLSLLSAFLMTIMPLGIYFGRNVQPESPALFFGLLASYFFIKWTEKLDKKTLLYSGLALSMAGLFKITFMIFLVPMFFIFPFTKVLIKLKEHKKKTIYNLSFFIIGLLPLIILRKIFEFAIVDPSKINLKFYFKEILGSVFWAKRMPAIKSYIADNFTWWYFYFATFGLALMLIKYKSKFSRFMLGWTIAIIPYVALIATKIGGHSYYQMPFLPLIAIASAYIIYMGGQILKQITKIPGIQFATLLVLLLTISSVSAANNRVWDVQFYGQDIVGEYIKTRSQGETNMFAWTHSQGLAICSYAQINCGFPRNLSEFKHKEKALDIDWLYIDASNMGKFNEKTELNKYIKENYNIQLIGAIQQGPQLAPLVFVYKKGKALNMSEIETKQTRLAKTYETTRGKVDYYIITND